MFLDILKLKCDFSIWNWIQSSKSNEYGAIPATHTTQNVRAYTELQKMYRHKWKNLTIFILGFYVHCANNVVLGYVSFSTNYLATLSTDSKSSPKNNLG